MNLSSFIGDQAKSHAATRFFQGEKGILTTLRLNREAVLKEHKSPVPARLILLRGKVFYEEIGATATELAEPFDYVAIPANHPHKLTAFEDSLLLLAQ